MERQVFPHSDVRLCKKTALAPNAVSVCPAGERDNDRSWPFVVFFSKPMNSRHWYVVYTLIWDLKVILQYIFFDMMALFALCLADSK